MKILFCIVVCQSLVWLSNTAPQPLSLINVTTINGLNDVTTISHSDSTVRDSGQSTSSSISTDSTDIASTTRLGDPVSESSTELANLREDLDSSTSEGASSTSTTVRIESDVTDSKIMDIGKDVTDSITSTGAFSKPLVNEEIVSESDIPITRYVPPLDPLKHMLMMADVKGMPNIANLMPKVNFKPVLSTSEASTNKDFETTTEDISSGSSEEIEKVVDESSENDENLEKIATEAPFIMSSDSLIRGSTETILFESSESSVENSEEKVPLESLESEEKVPLESLESEKKVSLELLELDEKIPLESLESEDKVPLKLLEPEENQPTSLKETTISEALPSSTLSLKSEELKSVTESVSDASTVSDITQNISTSTVIPETTLDSTEKPDELNKTLALHRNSETELESDEVTLEGEENKTVVNDETSALVFSSTEESIKVDDLTNSDNLLKSVEAKPETIFLEPEITTSSSAFPDKSETELVNRELFTTKENKDIISSTSTTIVPETTFENSLTTSMREKNNITLDDELEFRAVKIPILNASKVTYVKEKPNLEVNTVSSESSVTSESETESTTSSIFTTIAEILFSSTTTVAPENLIEENDEDAETLSTEKEYENTEIVLPIEKFEIKDDADTGTVLSNDPADMLKVQSAPIDLDSVPAKETSTLPPVTIDLESVPAKETSTLPPVTESKASETLPEKMFDEELEDVEKKDNEEDEKHIDGNVESEKLLNAFEDAITKTTVLSSSTTESTRNESSSTTTEASATEPKLEVKEDEIVENEPEIQTDPTTTEKLSDYLLNVQNRYVSGDNRDMVAAVQFLHYHDKASSEQCFKLVDAHWNYATNLTEENKKKQLEQTLEYSLFHKAAWKNATSFAWKSFNDTLLRRWFKSLSVLGTAALPEDKLNEFNKLKAEMKNTYSTAKICTYVNKESVRRGQILREKDCNLTLEPDLQRILTKSRDYDELVHVWKSWRDSAGKPIREKYLRFVELSNEASRMNGFSDTGDMWREAYESETFESDLEELWDQLKPLYEHLHAYVRRRLIQQYGADKIKEDGPIPAHLFGNMWAQSWVSLLDITQPYPGKPSVDVTPIMEAKNMTPYEMFKISEEFFTSLGLKPMPEPFWQHSLIEKPKDREIICHASAWDFCNGKDYRIKQCTDITMEDLITVHHEMGHIQYFLQYARQPNVFREGANPGFHEAIGDVLALSVSTPKHLKSIGLLDEVADDPEGDLNFLLYTALDKVSFLPSGYLIDLWRWGLFSGEIKPEEMNTKWWELRLKYQGVCPPLKRTDTDFDPGAKFHVPGNVPYIRYFVSFVIQFQFHKVLCDAAGHTGPLYKCDIYRSKEAGQILSQVMELGSSEHWSEAMKIMTGGATNKMDAGPILEYFDPLLQFLKEQNKNETIGWKSSDPTFCP